MVKTGIVTGFGINADIELGTAFEMAGSEVQSLPLTTLLDDTQALEGLDILGFPGGFSFGDHLGSGRVFAQLVKKNLQGVLRTFCERGGLVIGICNGFQVLVKMGILPNLQGDWTPEVSLVPNITGAFMDRWVQIRTNPRSSSPWIQGFEAMDVPIRHGEGRFLPRDEGVLQVLESQNLVALTYGGDNPNGSTGSIAGITDPSGRIFGLMPHPEAFLVKYNHPLWRRRKDIGPLGLRIFENAVEFVKKSKRS